MCGICGTSEENGARLVAAMNDAMIHRGPDDAGVHEEREGRMALGARRLSIIDVEAGHQPLCNEDGTVWAILNGEIYNHPELRDRLLADGHTFSSRTDTEVLVHLYEEHGDALVHALEGMFAFAIWDSRRRRLLLARDRFGEKPLFYSERAGQIRFASELTALLAADSTGPRIDPAAVAAFFVLGYVPGPGSIVEGVAQLPPASTLTWEPAAGRGRIAPYWSLPPESPAEPPDLDEVVEEAEGLLRRAIRGRLLADVPLGVFLSGGLDSTLLAAIAAEESGERLKTFSVGYDVGAVNEVDAAAKTAAALGAEHHELIIRQADLGDEVPTLLTAIDQPLADQSLLALGSLARFARERVTVVVGGEGADELFGGYPRYRWLARADAVDRRLGPRMRSASARLVGLAGGRRAQRLGTVIGGEDLFARHLDWVTGGRLELAPDVLGSRVDGEISILAADRSLLPESGTVAGSFMRLDQRLWLVDDVLAKADRASMLASLELRTPYLYPDLAELAAQLPGSVHAAMPGKAVLRRILAKRPRPALKRGKRAFEVPMADWLRGPLRELLVGSLSDGPLFDEGWFDRGAVNSLVRDHLERDRDRSAALWPIVCLAMWHEGVSSRAKSAVA